jgi:hypothetical protein
MGGVFGRDCLVPTLSSFVGGDPSRRGLAFRLSGGGGALCTPGIPLIWSWEGKDACFEWACPACHRPPQEVQP